MKWIDYREKLGIGFNDSDKTKMFLSKIKNRLSSAFRLFCGDHNMCSKYKKVIFEYYVEIGESIPLQANLFHILENILLETSLCGIISKYVAFLNVIYQNERKEEFRVFLDFLKMSLDELRIDYDIISDTEGVFIFPKGAKELDDALVSEPLEWLTAYPKSHTAWVKALKDYSEQTDENASDIADKFRKALETFFQEFFKSEKSLENYKTNYGDYLKSKSIPAELSGNFQKLLESYTNYINGYAKHHDNTSRNVLEYMMYQTGNIMRLLITLKQEDNNNAD